LPTPFWIIIQELPSIMVLTPFVSVKGCHRLTLYNNVKQIKTKNQKFSIFCQIDLVSKFLSSKDGANPLFSLFQPVKFFQESLHQSAILPEEK